MSHRKKVISTLEAISAAPPSAAPDLLRLWVEEAYVPSLRYLDSLKGDADASAVADFNDAFSEQELLALARFHRFLEIRLDRMGEQLELENTEFWQSTKQDVAMALQDMKNPTV